MIKIAKHGMLLNILYSYQYKRNIEAEVYKFDFKIKIFCWLMSYALPISLWLFFPVL